MEMEPGAFPRFRGGSQNNRRGAANKAMCYMKIKVPEPHQILATQSKGCVPGWNSIRAEHCACTWLLKVFELEELNQTSRLPEQKEKYCP